jgi:hypothetical protein
LGGDSGGKWALLGCCCEVEADVAMLELEGQRWLIAPRISWDGEWLAGDVPRVVISHRTAGANGPLPTSVVD